MKKTSLGIVLVIAPFALLIICLFGYAISNFILNATAPTQINQPVGDALNSELSLIQTPSTDITIAKSIHVILSLVSIIAVLGAPIFIGFGLYLLVRDEKKNLITKTNEPAHIDKLT